MPSSAINRLIVISFDAATAKLSANPNPIQVAADRTLYFALQTLNRGEIGEAVFTAIYEDHAFVSAAQTNDCPQLWVVHLNEEVTSQTTYFYTVRISYNGKEHTLDPSVVLLPTPPVPK